MSATIATAAAHWAGVGAVPRLAAEGNGLNLIMTPQNLPTPLSYFRRETIDHALLYSRLRRGPRHRFGDRPVRPAPHP